MVNSIQFEKPPSLRGLPIFAMPEGEDIGIVVTGPRRNLMRESTLHTYFVVPFGNMMIAGCNCRNITRVRQYDPCIATRGGRQRYYPLRNRMMDNCNWYILDNGFPH